MRANSWRFEVIRLVVVGVVSFAIGSAFQQPWLVVSLGLLSLLIWHIVQLRKLYLWLANGGRSKYAPEMQGAYQDIGAEVLSWKLKNRTRKKNLTRILKRVRQFTEALPDATIILNRRNEIENINNAAKEMLGIKKGGDYGRRIDHLMRDPRFKAYLDNGVFSHALEIRAVNREQQSLEVRVVDYGDEQRLMTVRDMTATRRVEAMRRDFIANVSHELRTPLTVVAGYAEVLLEEELNPEIEQGIRSMQRQATRMAALVEDLLVLSQLETSNPTLEGAEVVIVSELVSRLCEDAMRLSPNGSHNIQVNLDDDLCLLGTTSEINSAFGNIINNAVRHTEDGTAIHVTWECLGDGGAQLVVRDEGMGIDQDHLPRLTERFYRVDPGRSRNKGGTGLGLSIVKHAVQRNDGELLVDSERGVGSTFTCRFPESRITTNKELESSAFATT